MVVDAKNINFEDVIYYRKNNVIVPVVIPAPILKIGKQFILFNRDLHYWVSIDEIGASILNCAKNRDTVNALFETLRSVYGIDKSVFVSDVLPFVLEMSDYGFLSINQDDDSVFGWPNPARHIHDHQKYPFNCLYMSLTENCNLDCLYCFNKTRRTNRHHNIKHQTMEPDQVIQCLQQFKKIEGKQVVFTGGEPILNGNLLYFCEKAIEIGLEPSFITNGVLLKKLDLNRLINCVKSFSISIDTIDDKEATILWNNANYSISEDIIPSLLEIDRLVAKTGRSLKITIQPTITRINLASISNTLNRLSSLMPNCEMNLGLGCYQKIGIESVDNLLLPSGESYNEQALDGLVNYSLQCGTNVTKQDNSVAERAKLIALRYIINENGKGVPREHPIFLTCAPSFFVSSTGDVFACQGYDEDNYCLGNFNDANLVDMFNGEIFHQIRNKTNFENHTDCSDCAFLYICQKGCPAKMNADEWGKMQEISTDGIKKCQSKMAQKLWIETQMRCQ
jgi:radical SAM protein with 4Fe4S-binding SPASM domain